MSKYNSGNLSSSLDFAQSFMKQNYRDGAAVVGKTSASVNMSKAGSYSLNNGVVANYLDGGYLRRTVGMAMIDYNKNIQSSLKGVVLTAAESASGLTVRDPNSTNSRDVEKVTGAAAISELLKVSGLGNIRASDIMAPIIDGINQDYGNYSNDGVVIAGSPHDGETLTFSNVELVGASPRPNTGGIALQSQMQQDEIGWLSDRARLLKEYGIVEDENVLVDGFTFDLPDDLRNLEQNYGLNNERRFKGDVLQEVVTRSGEEVAYLAPALIELLIYLGSNESDIRIVCRTGAGGSVTSEEFGMNVDNLSNQSMVNDHVFGRAVDVIAVTNRDGSGGSSDLPNSGSSVAIYRAAFELLMDELNKVGLTHPYLLPDSICIHSGLKAELEIQDGDFEAQNASLRIAYPGLKYVDFITSDYAKKYIHLSFGAARCGVYSGPGVLSMGTRTLSNGSDSSFSVDLNSGVGSALVLQDGEVIGSAALFSNQKFNTPFIGDMANQSLSRDEVYSLLLSVMQPEAAAIFCAISVREGGLRPAAFNPDNWADNDVPLPTATNPHSTQSSGQNSGVASSSYGISFPLIATSQSLYDTARTVLNYPNPESRYEHNVPSYATVQNWTAADNFDCSGFIFWAAHEVGIAINFSQRRVERVQDVPDLYSNPSWDWSYTQDIIDIMSTYGTKFTDPSGERIIGTDIPKPDYNRFFNTPGAVLIRGPEDISGQGGHAVMAKGDGTRTILHAAGSNVGLAEQTLSEESMYNYWHCGLIPGTYVENSSGSVSSAGSDDLTYSVSDVGLHGDWSVGMFQVNLLPNANGQRQFFLPSPAPGESIPGWKLGLGNWQNYGLTTAAQAGAKMADLYSSYRGRNHNQAVQDLIDEPDERVWVPINQAYMLYVVATGRNPNLIMAEADKAGRNYEYIFWPWGDYSGGPTYGFISNVSFDTAVEIYEANTSGTRQDLVDWTLRMFENAIKSNGEPSPAREHAQGWVNGTIYRSNYDRASGRFVDAGTE